MPSQNIYVQFSIIYCMVHMLVLFSLFYEYRGSRRRFWSVTGPVIGLLSAVFVYLLVTRGVAVMGQYGLVLGAVPTLLLFFAFAKDRNAKFVFIFCLADTVNIWLQLSSGLIDYAVGGGGLVTLFLRVSAYPVLEYVVWRWLRRPFLEIGNSFRGGWALFAALTGVCYVLLALVSVYPTVIYQRPQDIPMAVTLLVLVALTYTTIFIALHQQNELFRARERQRTFEIQTLMMEQRVSQLRDAEGRFRVERHDLRHRLLTIASLLQQGDAQAALDYIGASQQALGATEVERYCADPALDAVLSSYFRQARELDVQLETHIDLPARLPVPSAELSTVFANALENMIHAVRELPVGERRMICKCIHTPCLMMEFSNPCGGEVRLGSDGLPVPRDAGHGIGTRSIAAFAEKYQAICSFQVENGWFKLRLAL